MQDNAIRSTNNPNNSNITNTHHELGMVQTAFIPLSADQVLAQTRTRLLPHHPAPGVHPLVRRAACCMPIPIHCDAVCMKPAQDSAEQRRRMLGLPSLQPYTTTLRRQTPCLTAVSMCSRAPRISSDVGGCWPAFIRRGRVPGSCRVGLSYDWLSYIMDAFFLWVRTTAGARFLQKRPCWPGRARQIWLSRDITNHRPRLHHEISDRKKLPDVAAYASTSCPSP